MPHFIFNTVFVILFSLSVCKGFCSASETNESGQKIQTGKNHANSSSLVPLLLKDGKGGGAILSNGREYAVWGVEINLWQSIRGDLQMLDNYIEASLYINANSIAVHLPWRTMEPRKDEYDFYFLSECLQRAEQNGLKVVVYFGNSNYAAGDPAFVPDYIRSDQETYTQVQGKGFRETPVTGHAILALCPSNPALLERERKAYCEMMKFLKEFDTNRNVLAVHYGSEMNFLQSLKSEFIGWNNPEVRCECGHCNAAYDGGGEVEFMTRQFSSYIASVVDAGAEIYPLPVYAAVAPRSYWGGNWRSNENGEAHKAAVKFDSFFVTPSIAETLNISRFKKEIDYYLPDKIPGNLAFASGIDTGHGTPGGPHETSPVMSWPHLETAPWVNIFDYKSLGAIYWDHPAVTVSHPSSGKLVREKFRAFWAPLRGAGNKLTTIRNLPDDQMHWWTCDHDVTAAELQGYGLSVKQDSKTNYGFAFRDGDSLVLTATVYQEAGTEITVTHEGGWKGYLRSRGCFDDDGHWTARDTSVIDTEEHSMMFRFEGDNGDASGALLRLTPPVK